VPYPGFGLGALDPFHGYVVYRLLDEDALAGEIRDMKTIVVRSYRDLVITAGPRSWNDAVDDKLLSRRALGSCSRERSLAILDRMWIDPPGYFFRELGVPSVKFAFTNYGVSLGLQAVEAWPKRVARLNSFSETYRSGDEYNTDAITHVMASVSSGEFIPQRVGT
jgi:hypothetical protein